MRCNCLSNCILFYLIAIVSKTTPLFHKSQTQAFSWCSPALWVIFNNSSFSFLLFLFSLWLFRMADRSVHTTQDTSKQQFEIKRNFAVLFWQLLPIKLIILVNSDILCSSGEWHSAKLKRTNWHELTWECYCSHTYSSFFDYLCFRI